jgi:hypothetical protein
VIGVVRSRRGLARVHRTPPALRTSQHQLSSSVGPVATVVLLGHWCATTCVLLPRTGCPHRLPRTGCSRARPPVLPLGSHRRRCGSCSCARSLRCCSRRQAAAVGTTPATTVSDRCVLPRVQPRASSAQINAVEDRLPSCGVRRGVVSGALFCLVVIPPCSQWRSCS